MRFHNAALVGTLLLGSIALLEAGTAQGVCLFYFPDADGDTYGADVSPTQFCGSPPGGYVLNHLDCDDTDDDIRPGAPERSGNVDHDCDGYYSEPDFLFTRDGTDILGGYTADPDGVTTVLSGGGSDYTDPARCKGSAKFVYVKDGTEIHIGAFQTGSGLSVDTDLLVDEGTDIKDPACIYDADGSGSGALYRVAWVDAQDDGISTPPPYPSIYGANFNTSFTQVGSTSTIVADGHRPSWRPTVAGGAQMGLAFNGEQLGSNTDVLFMAVDSSLAPVSGYPVCMICDDAGEQQDLDWSADGEMVSYVAIYGSTGEDAQANVFVRSSSLTGTAHTYPLWDASGPTGEKGDNMSDDGDNDLDGTCTHPQLSADGGTVVFAHDFGSGTPNRSVVLIDTSTEDMTLIDSDETPSPDDDVPTWGLF